MTVVPTKSAAHECSMAPVVATGANAQSCVAPVVATGAMEQSCVAPVVGKCVTAKPSC